MIFLTVGTLFPFDRLVSAVDQLVGKKIITERIFAQIGENVYPPKNFEAASTLQQEEFDNYFSQADAIISHAGMGTIIMALDKQTPVLVMPREKRYGEHVNDHQVATARKLEEQKCVLAAYCPEELESKISELKTFVPNKRVANAQAVVNRINAYLSHLENIKS